jgi:threonine/homoserine/homoserine lactone efflux protein
VVAIVSAYFGISVSASAQSKVQATSAAALTNQKDSSDKALAAQKDSSDKALAAGLLANSTDPQAVATLNALVSRLVPDQAGSSAGQ